MLNINAKQEAAAGQRAAVRVSGAGRAGSFVSILQRVFKGLAEASGAAAKAKAGREAPLSAEAPRKPAAPEAPAGSSAKREAGRLERNVRPERRRAREKTRTEGSAADAMAAAGPAQTQARPVNLDPGAGPRAEKRTAGLELEAGAARARPAGARKTAAEPPQRDFLTPAEGPSARSPAGAGKKARPAEAEGEPVRKGAKSPLKVKDLRSERSSEVQTERPAAEPVKAEEPRREAQRDPAIQAAGEREPRAAGREQGREAAAEGAAELRRQFREEANQRIVREAAVVLRDRDEGEIRLVLRPENLGRVRIKLELHDNRIEGTFFVENGNIRELVEQNLPDLARAFRDSGFELGNFDVAVGDERRHRRKDEPARGAGRVVEKAAPLYERGASPYELNAVNIVV